MPKYKTTARDRQRFNLDIHEAGKATDYKNQSDTFITSTRMLNDIDKYHVDWRNAREKQYSQGAKNIPNAPSRAQSLNTMLNTPVIDREVSNKVYRKNSAGEYAKIPFYIQDKRRSLYGAGIRGREEAKTINVPVVGMFGADDKFIDLPNGLGRYRGNNEKSRIIFDEKTKAMDNTVPYKQIDTILKDKPHNSEETYKQMMRFRNNNWLSPDSTYDAKELRRQPIEEPVVRDYDDKTIERLFNTVVENKKKRKIEILHNT